MDENFDVSTIPVHPTQNEVDQTFSGCWFLKF
jgi:hypothetical protein